MAGETRRVTVYDVARSLGISPSTVSRVLNNSILIGDGRRALILETARKMGYEKRSIRKQSSRAILNMYLFLPLSESSYIHLFYDVADLIMGLQRGFGEVRINIITRLNDGNDAFFSSKKLGDVDGAVFAFTEPSGKLHAELEARGIPSIQINRVDERRNYVAVDNYLGMHTLLARMAEERPGVRPCFVGFKQIAYINEQRREGLIQAGRKLGIEVGAGDSFEFDSIHDITGSFIRGLKDRGYDAILGFNDVVAVYIYNAARSEGVSFPGDFFLSGFDASPILGLIPQKIDSIQFSIDELGFRAGAWLRRRIIEKDPKPEQTSFAGAYVAGATIAAPREVAS
jgi:LacI family transcriptional regulator